MNRWSRSWLSGVEEQTYSLDYDFTVDRAAQFERNIMNDPDYDGVIWQSDWFWDDDCIDILKETEYRIYEQDCFEVEIREAGEDY